MPASDRLTPLLERFRVETRLFHAGALCGVTTFPAQPGRGFLHVLRSGTLTTTYRDPDGTLRSIAVERPSVILSPGSVEHAFHTDARDGSDFTCASLDVAGGATHPLLATLPPMLVVPLDELGSAEHVLRLLFDEVDDVRCGHRLVADRLFEVVLIQVLRWILDHVDELGVPAGLLTGLADARLAPALAAVHASPGAAWSLDAMAREARMSRSAFAARFREVVGASPGDHLTRWRLTVAQERLRAGASIADAAAEVGYGSASALSRAFSQHLGRSPRAWLGELAAAAAG